MSEPLGLYLHYPFCSNHCHYCDFYKETYDADAEQRYFAALAIETSLAALHYRLRGRTLGSIYIGGGTPSLADLNLLSTWLDQVSYLFSFDSKMEFTLEVNPESANLEKLQAWKLLGVNRPVFGVQSFNPALLKRLGRVHNPVDTQRAIYQANVTGYDNFGTDLIFGLPGQTSRMMLADLAELLDLRPPHVSFYQLTVEPGTKLARQVGSGRLRLPDQDTCLAMYRGGSEKLADSGYRRYEVSSFAQPGFECRHNLGYWTGREYLGLGPAAHSFLGEERYANPASLTTYLAMLAARHLPAVRDESGLPERMAEAIMLGLRTAQGLDRRRFSQRFGRPVDECLDPRQYELLIASEHLSDNNDFLRLTERGIVLADEITRRIVRFSGPL